MTTLKTNSLLCIGIGAFFIALASLTMMFICLYDKLYSECAIWSIAGIGFGTLTYLVGDYMEYRRKCEW